MDDKIKNINYPDARGHFGQFGGKYVIETLMPALDELEKLYYEARQDQESVLTTQIPDICSFFCFQFANKIEFIFF